jgi:hypothetical protein
LVALLCLPAASLDARQTSDESLCAPNALVEPAALSLSFNGSERQLRPPLPAGCSQH